jgi:hypothetical protein
MFKSIIKDFKQTWKPALLTWIATVIINLITGWSMDYIIVGIFGVLFVLILLWGVYSYVKNKLT